MNELFHGYSSPRFADACSRAKDLSLENPNQTARVYRIYYDPDDVDPLCGVMLGPGPLADGSIGEIGHTILAVYYRGELS